MRDGTASPSCDGVKHLNPRQGITTAQARRVRLDIRDLFRGVKHLNPRQGITTQYVYYPRQQDFDKCETPKSPPGDYN